MNRLGLVIVIRRRKIVLAQPLWPRIKELGNAWHTVLKRQFWCQARKCCGCSLEKESNRESESESTPPPSLAHPNGYEGQVITSFKTTLGPIFSFCLLGMLFGIEHIPRLCLVDVTTMRYSRIKKDRSMSNYHWIWKSCSLYPRRRKMDSWVSLPTCPDHAIYIKQKWIIIQHCGPDILIQENHYYDTWQQMHTSGFVRCKKR